MLSKINDDKRLIHSKIDNRQFMIGNKTDKIINAFFKSVFTTILGKIFETKQRNPVKVDRTRKLWYLLLRIFDATAKV